MPTGQPTKKKQCSICGDMFLPAKPSSRICSKDHYVKCPICGKEIIWNTTRKIEPCSKECRKENRRRLNLAKYGTEHPMQSKEVQQRHKQAMLEKYGVESPLQSSEIKQKVISTNRKKFGTDWALGSKEVVEKSKQTMTDRYGAPTTLQSRELATKVRSTMVSKYGTDNPSKCKDIRETIVNTNLQKYGVDNPMKVPEIAQKSAQSRSANLDDIWEKSKCTWMETLGVDNPAKSKQVIDKITDTFLTRYGVVRAVHVPEFREKMRQTMISKYGVPYYHMTEEFKQSQHFRISNVNKLFAGRLTSTGLDVEFEMPIGQKSYDLHLSGTNTLIEIDPTYTHNIIGNHWSSKGLDKYYHRDKSQVAVDNGYRCIHVFDWDNWDKIVDMLKPRERVYARNLEIYKLNNSVVDEFLNKYHLQGTCRGQLLCLGLVKDNVLYQVMTFGKSRYDKKHSIELLRLCTLPGYTVIGGASRLFSYATVQFGLYNIISYCDRSKFTGDVYEKIGMKLIRTTPPQEIWSRGNSKITANLLRQRGYDQLFNTDYGKGVSNEQLMIENGWLPVYDCGQFVYSFD